MRGFVVVAAFLVLATVPAYAGYAELMEAAKQGDLAAAEVELGAGVSPNEEFGDGLSPLMWAARWGNSDMVALLLAHGAETELTDYSGQTALLMAAYFGHSDAVRLLLDAGANADATDEGDWTPILVSLMDHPEATPEAHHAVTMMLAAAVDDLGPALVAAAWGGDVEAAELLLARGADPNAKDYRGLTALVGAAELEDTRLFEALVAAGANVGEQGAPALHSAASAGRAALIVRLLELGVAVDVRDDAGSMPLTRAAMRGCVECVEALLAAGADRDPRDARGLDIEVYMAIMPTVFQSSIEGAEATDQETAELAAELEAVLANHEMIRALLKS